MNSSQAAVDKADTLAVSMSDLRFSYAKQSAVFQCEQFSLQTGKRIFLQGASGSGKSTLLSLIAGIAKPTEGRIILNNTSLTELSSAQRDLFRAKHIGVVFQQFNLIPYLSVQENVALAAYFAKSSQDLKMTTADMLEQLQLPSSVLATPVADLSVGQRQRVAIMRALINKPELLLVDEPTSALDASARDGFMQMLLNMTTESNASLIFVSHDQALSDYFDKHIQLSDICRWDTKIKESA